jgi:hypothetical protein
MDGKAANPKILARVNKTEQTGLP